MDTKVIDPAYIGVVCEELRRQGSVLVFTNGVFDLLHPGHVLYLEEARALGTHLIVALNTDDSVQRIKGRMRPIMPLESRAEILAALDCVSFVTWFEQDTPAEIIRTVQPDVLVKGGDWTPDRIVGKDFVESRGGRVLNIPFQKGYSTSAIIEKILHL